MMYVLKTNIATRLAVGPFVDPTDGKTAETALTVTGIACQLYRMDAGNAVTRTAITLAASGSNNDMILVPSSTDGVYDLELTATQLNFLGNALLCFYDVDGHLITFKDLQVVSANWWDFMFGSTPLVVSLTSTALAEVADKNLGRNVMGGSDGGRTVSESFCGIRNKHGIDPVDGKYKVYETDDSTLSWEATVTASQGAVPVTEINPD